MAVPEDDCQELDELPAGFQEVAAKGARDGDEGPPAVPDSALNMTACANFVIALSSEFRSRFSLPQADL